MYSSPDDMTIGMRLDALLERAHSAPSAVVYGIFAATSIAFAFLLMNSDRHVPKQISTELNTIVKPPPKLKRSSSDSTPQPKWHILKILNYAAVSGFLFSLMNFASDTSHIINDTGSLLKFMAGWSVFLCYFFGFFGISFVDADEMVFSQMPTENSSNDVQFSSEKTNYPLHPPAKSIHPVCTTQKSKPTKLVTKAILPSNIKSLSDEDLANLVLTNQIKDHQLEKLLDPERAVTVRRLAFDHKLSSVGCPNALDDLPEGPSLDYSRVFGANCEIVVGYIPIPVGIVGPLTLNGETVYIPMATTEGCLIASTNRGCKAISSGSGAVSTITRDGITRAPCLRMCSAKEAAELKIWCETAKYFDLLKGAFESTTSFGKLINVNPIVAGRNVYLRLTCFSGDAMGMNMVSKGSLAVVDLLRVHFPTLELVALSGNVCTDKKAAAINWIEGRGKSVVVEAIIPHHIVKSILKTDVSRIVSTNIQKNLIGSAMAGVVGGFNAHAANNVTAIFLATGQDPAQNVESSNCITLCEETDCGDLWISCTMPSIEVGTVGGGTGLPAQSACLKVIGCKGGGQSPGQNAKQLAHVVASGVMAGELSLLAALAANTLVAAHMQHNRKK